MKKKLILAMSFMLTVSCSSNGSSSSDRSPIVKTEIYTESTSSSSEKPEDSKKPVVKLSYAIMGPLPDDELNMIKQFNEADNGYVIETRDYADYFSQKTQNGYPIYDDNEALAVNITLMQDIVEGEIDILCDLHLPMTRTMDRLEAQGAFTDLYEFMANDTEVNKTALNSHILGLHEKNGKLYTLPTYYMFQTLIGEERYVGSKENWTLDELISHWNNMPEGSTINRSTQKDNVYRAIIRSTFSRYIDYDDASVSFDCEEFRRGLEFCAGFDAIPYEKYDEFSDTPVFVSPMLCAGFSDFHRQMQNKNGQSYTLAGYPSENGNGGIIITSGERFAISAAASKEKQLGAWEFVRSLCLEDYQTEHYCIKRNEIVDGETEELCQGYHGFPINNSVYNKLAEETMAGKFKDNTDDPLDMVTKITPEELKRLTEYVQSINTLDSSIDRDLYTIMDEEILSYLNGEVSLDSCIALIQNRAEIMVSERE